MTRGHQEIAAIHQEATARDLIPKFSFISKDQFQKSPPLILALPKKNPQINPWVVWSCGQGWCRLSPLSGPSPTRPKGLPYERPKTGTEGGCHDPWPGCATASCPPRPLPLVPVRVIFRASCFTTAASHPPASPNLRLWACSPPLPEGRKLYRLEFLQFKFCTKFLYAITWVFLRIYARIR